MRIGLISDTHGLLRPEAIAFLQGSDHIVHAGDIGDPSILDALRAMAPLTVVRGNNDRQPWAASLPETEMIEVGGALLYVVHDLHELDIDPASVEVRAVISGHSHKPSVAERDGVLYVNPGSAGPRRFRLPIAAGELIVGDGRVSARTATIAE